MADAVYVNTVLKSTAAAPFQVAYTGFGHQPQALIMTHINQAGAESDSNGQLGIGFSDGTDSFSVYVNSQTGQAAPNTHRSSSTAIAHARDFADALEWNVSLDSFDTNGITVGSTTNDAEQVRLSMCSLSGVNAKVGTFTSKGSTGTQAITGVGFQPVMVFLLTAALTSAVDDNDDLFLSWGCAETNGVAPFTQWCALTRELDLTANGASRLLRNDILVGKMSSSAGATTATTRGTLSATSSDGFTINWVAHADAAFTVGYLAIGGITSGAGTATTPTATGSDSITGLGFQPQVVFTANGGAGLTGFGTGSTGMSLQLGYGHTTADSVSNDIAADNIKTPTESDCEATSGLLVTLDGGGLAANIHEAELTSLDADGFTLNYTKVSIPANYIWCYSALSGMVGIGGQEAVEALAADCDAPSLSTEVAVANCAFLELGLQPFTSFTDGSRYATLATAVFNPTRKALQQEFRWEFCLRRRTLSLNIPSQVTWDFNYAYALPEEMIQLWEVGQPHSGIRWRVENKHLLTNERSVDILYSISVANPDKWSVTFGEALCYKLASKMAMSLLHKPEIMKMYYELYKDTAAMGAFLDNTQSDDTHAFSSLLSSARGGFFSREIPLELD